MKAKTIGLGVMIASLLLGLSQATIAREPPVAKLVQVEGQVEYTRNGTRWNPVRRTKYLFPGYKIKTGKDGSGKLISQQTGKSQQLGSDSEIEVMADSRILDRNITVRFSSNRSGTPFHYHLVNRLFVFQDNNLYDHSALNSRLSFYSNQLTIFSINPPSLG